MAKRWLSMTEISANLGVNPDTIYEWISRRAMPVPKPTCLSPPPPIEAGCFAPRLAVMNLTESGIKVDLGPEDGDSFRRDRSPDLRDHTSTRVSANPQPRSHLAVLLGSERQPLANPAFSDFDWFRKDDDMGEQDGVLPKSNAKFTWVPQFIRHPAPQVTAGLVLANGSMSSNQSGECDIRRTLIKRRRHSPHLP